MYEPSIIYQQIVLIQETNLHGCDNLSLRAASATVNTLGHTGKGKRSASHRRRKEQKAKVLRKAKIDSVSFVSLL
jgi:hypothetical protein